jgi:hypothetical protein
MRIHRSRAAIALGVTAAGVAAAVTLSACAGQPSASQPSASQPGTNQPGTNQPSPAEFAWFHARPALDGWHRISLPDGQAVLSYPQSLHALASDQGTVSEGLTTNSGTALVYLNVTPRQGDETLRDWPEFRLDHLLEDDASAARMTGQATGLKFRGGLGSCVLDAYTTKVHANYFREIACFVQGARGSSVLVAATPAGDWGTYAGLLEQAVTSYAVS